MSFRSSLGKSTARLVRFFFLPLIFCAVCAPAEQIKNLKPQGYVNDFAGVLSAPAKEKLAALCAEVDRKTGAQIAVVTVSSLGGEPVEQFSLDLATQWGVGPKQQARGVLILIAPNDRKYRVEVGYGLEAILPDGKVGGFGREMIPLLQRNDYGGAVTLLTERIAAVIATDRTSLGYSFLLFFSFSRCWGSSFGFFSADSWVRAAVGADGGWVGRATVGARGEIGRA